MMSLTVWLPGPMFLPGAGFCPGGLCPGDGVSVQGGLCPEGVSVRETPYTVNNRRHASYWNSFLLIILVN